MILELAVFCLFFSLELDLIHKFTKNLEHLSAPKHREVSTSSPGSATCNVLPGLLGSLTGLCTSWFTWKFDRPMYHLDYLEICPAYVPAGLPGSLTGLCTTWFTWKYARPMYQLVYLEV